MTILLTWETRIRSAHKVVRMTKDGSAQDREQSFGETASYQWKDPFGALEMDSSGAFLQSWWAMVDALRTA